VTLARAAKILRRRLLWLENRVKHRPADAPPLASSDINDDGVMAEIEALRTILALHPAPPTDGGAC
jgi:hypothetical protein